MPKLAHSFVLAAALAALLAGCATVAPSQAPVAAYRDSIELVGRLAVNYHKDDKPEALSGKFSWSQTPAVLNISLASPLGQTVAKIVVTAQGATLTEANGATRVAADIDALTRAALGWPLPVAGLRDWLQGYATAADGTRFAATPASNSVVTADGWRLTFVSWQDPSAAQSAPKRIDAVRVTPEAGELSIRIVIDA